MKDNLIRLSAAVLLLLCLAASAKIMAQTPFAGDLAWTNIHPDPHDPGADFGSEVQLIQPADQSANPLVQVSDLDAEPPAQPEFYAVVDHMKVLPGAWDKYLEVEKAWKKIHEARKTRGEIIDWQFFQCLFPNGTDASYDFVTVTYYKSGKELGSADWSWATLTKGLTPAEIEIANGAEKTRNLTNQHLFAYFGGCEPPGCTPGKYLQLFFNRAKPGKMRDYEKFMEDGTAMRNEAVKSGKVKTWTHWKRVYPGSPDLESHVTVYTYDNMDSLLKNSAPVDFSAELKKVKPAQSYDDFLKQMNELREPIGSEVWLLVDGTQ